MSYYFVKLQCDITKIEEDLICELDLVEYSIDEIKHGIINYKKMHGEKFISPYLNDENLNMEVMKIINIGKL